MKRNLLAALVAATVAAAVLVPVRLLADLVTCSVNLGSYADGVVNPPTGEDAEFFVSSGGVPNIMFVLDTSASMKRLAPDGAASSWGTFGNGYGCSNAWANARVFSSPCGRLMLAGGVNAEGQPFNPNPGSPPPNWASDPKDASGRYCPYMVAGGQPPATDKPGFDPDFYGGGGGNPWFFEAEKVYHDAIVTPFPFADGWSDWSTSPAPYATSTDFCNQWSGTPAKATECGRCMRDQGYFFDGSYVAYSGMSCGKTSECQAKNAGICVTDGSTDEYNGGTKDGNKHCRYPHVWFSGNFLNFNPPKFVVARKVLKDVLQAVRRVRLGLTIFDSPDGGSLLEGLNPACNQVSSPSSFDSNRGAILNAVNNKNLVGFSGGTPLAETLLDVGNYYLANGQTWFDSTYQHTGFQEKSGQNVKSICFSCQSSAVLLITDGLATYDGEIPGAGFATSAMTLSVANAAGSVAGMAGYNITGISAADCPICETAAEAADTTVAAGSCIGQQTSGACDDAENPIPSYLPKVAWYLKNMDFRPNGEATTDGMLMTKKQSVATYTIGLGTRGNASLILDHTAQAGGGLYNGGTGKDVNDASTLRDAIMKVLEDVNTRSTAFGAASMSTLQLQSTQGVLLPRFEPSRTAHWNGHLFAFDMWSEFSGNCRTVATGSGPGNGDYNCDGRCDGVFLKDADGDFIQEDSTGAFKKNLDRTKGPCTGSKCSAGSCSEADPNAPAKPFWDAGSKMAPVTMRTDPVSGITVESANLDFVSGGRMEWYNRKIYTAIDLNGDNRIDRSDDALDPGFALVELKSDDVTAGKLVPYLNIKGTRYCQSLAARLTSRGNTRGATIATQLASGDYSGCAKVIIDFARGADVFNERGASQCPGFPGTYCTRKYQLGDIFHSSPIEVRPPATSANWACNGGLDPQCLTTLFSGPTAAGPSAVTPPNATAYDDYAKSARYSKRKKFALVGANDGFLHAFSMQRYLADGTTRNPRLGEEIWAFVPPDLLAKLRLLTESAHQFFVDATPMVRNVWIDNAFVSDTPTGPAYPANGITSGVASADGVKQGKEFHTIAVVGERRGGTRYFALDITDASDELDAKPRFLWTYPQPTDPESLAFGETYVDYVPKAPPIGPVKLDRGAPPCKTGSILDPDGSNRCFEERWIVFLAGGFDPQYTRGRGVHMVDLATGKELWDFSQPSGPASGCDTTQDPRCHLNYPVAATVGMVMWGPSEVTNYAGNRYYFDTATFGDTGGQLWTLRFFQPGQLDPATGRITNWFGGRALQHGLNASTPACGLGYCDAQPFFFITTNVPLQASGLYRTLNGTGDRFNVLDPLGGTCGPDNIRACLLKGCTVTIGDGAGGPGAVYGLEPMLGKQSYQADHPAYCTAVDPTRYRYDVTAAGAAACTTLTTKIDAITITCPSTKTCSGATEATRKSASALCTADSCEPASANQLGIPIDVKSNPDKLNWFFSATVFQTSGPRMIFTDLDGAKRYDAARLKEGDLKNVNAYDYAPTAANLATAEGVGWSYYFDHGDPSPKTPWTVAMAGVDHHVYRTDERLAGVSGADFGCTVWSTIQTGVPTGGFDATSGCPINSPCKAGRAQISYLYGANTGTGATCLTGADGTSTRSQKSEVIAIPQTGQTVYYVGGNQVMPGLTRSEPGKGASTTSLAEAQDLAAATEWLPVDRSAHDCRHVKKETEGGTRPTDAACRQQ